MKKIINIAILFLFQLLSNAQHVYNNPVISVSGPDPTIIKRGNYFYLYHTGGYVPIYRSEDLVTWTRIGNSFSNESHPTFVENGGIWAPDINYIKGRYVMYYSMSTWGGVTTCGIGIGVSHSPAGGFTDRGKLFDSKEIGVKNSIDPFYYEEDDGRKYLFWGSFYGIYAIELSDDGLSVKEGAEKKQIAGSLTEGTYIYKHNGYYYLIGSAGTCCEGLNSTYRLVVARSRSLLGPYIDKNGNSALSNNFSDLLNASNETKGPGHCSEIVEDDNGQTWILYHGYQVSDPDAGRCVYLDQVMWDDKGWPYIITDKPSNNWFRPVFGQKEYSYSKLEYVEYKGKSQNYTFLYDTGYIPNALTSVELECMFYERDRENNTTLGSGRAVFSGRRTSIDGISLYQNKNGNAFGYYVGDYTNEEVTPLMYNVRYLIMADKSGITIDNKKHNTIINQYIATTQRLTLFSGLEDYPLIGRIYYLNIYTGGVLKHSLHPVLRNEDNTVMFYDSVNDSYLLPSSPYAFSSGDIIDDIGEVNQSVGVVYDETMYNLSGQQVNNTYKGLIIKNNKKYLTK